MIRTPREWDETCRECRGSGKVHIREVFSLWTPDEHAKHMGAEWGAPKIDPKHKGADDVPANAVVCCAVGGCSIFEACKEGVTLARAFGRPVAFEFNDAIAICHSDSDPVEVSKRWVEARVRQDVRRIHGGQVGVKQSFCARTPATTPERNGNEHR